MKKAKLFADKNIRIGKVEDEVFGSFIEHLGRAVYEGIYEPGHPQADKDGFRKDVLELIRQLKVPLVRYPGGNFLSGYDWRDGIGPVEKRPMKLDLAWMTRESNRFGTDEFMRWCDKAGTRPMMAVNLGTGTPKDAAELVEYCNFEGGSYWSDLRGANGHKAPYKVETWCLGNEMDGPWQICHLNAEDYAKKALEAAKMMRWVDPSIKLVACGSSGHGMPTFPEWDRTVLETLYDTVDYISMHRYYWYDGQNLEDFAASYKNMNDFVATIKATADYVAAKLRSPKKMMISFDEWNVWNQTKSGTAGWAEAPHILEDNYTVLDALVFGGMLNTLINNCDRVKVACLAQLVNVIAPIFTEKGGKAIKQTIFDPLVLVSNYGRGEAMYVISDCDTFTSKKFGDAQYLSSSVVYDAEENAISVFLANYCQEKLETEIELRSFGALEAIDRKELTGSLMDTNTFDAPDRVRAVDAERPQVKDGKVTLTLPPMSWTMLRLKCK